MAVIKPAIPYVKIAMDSIACGAEFERAGALLDLYSGHWAQPLQMRALHGQRCDRGFRLFHIGACTEHGHGARGSLASQGRQCRITRSMRRGSAFPQSLGRLPLRVHSPGPCLDLIKYLDQAEGLGGELINHGTWKTV